MWCVDHSSGGSWYVGCLIVVAVVVSSCFLCCVDVIIWCTYGFSLSICCDLLGLLLIYCDLLVHVSVVICWASSELQSCWCKPSSELQPRAPLVAGAMFAPWSRRLGQPHMVAPPKAAGAPDAAAGWRECLAGA